MKSLKEADDSSMVIFLNGRNDYCFYDREAPELLEHVYPIHISIEADPTSAIEESREETIYVFCKNQAILGLLQRLGQLSISRILKHSGIKLQLKPVTETELQSKRSEIRKIRLTAEGAAEQ